jgi:pimeloyl-ACP methyl ester carboxylesterase
LQEHGHTADVDQPLCYEAMADGVAELTRHLGLATADFVGYSMGGGVAVPVALDHANLARRVVFAGGASYRPRWSPP